MAILLANAAATLYLTGLIWTIQRVHYPLFADVGRAAWGAYHRHHLRRITPVVAPPMVVELVTSAWLVLDRPDGIGVLAPAAGLGLAVAVWVLTAVIFVPAHDRLARDWSPAEARRLVARNRWRTAAWSVHAVLVLGMLAAA